MIYIGLYIFKVRCVPEKLKTKKNKQTNKKPRNVGYLSVKPTIISVRIRKSLGLFRILREVS